MRGCEECVASSAQARSRGTLCSMTLRLSPLPRAASKDMAESLIDRAMAEYGGRDWTYYSSGNGKAHARVLGHPGHHRGLTQGALREPGTTKRTRTRVDVVEGLGEIGYLFEIGGLIKDNKSKLLLYGIRPAQPLPHHMKMSVIFQPAGRNTHRDESDPLRVERGAIEGRNAAGRR